MKKCVKRLSSSARPPTEPKHLTPRLGIPALMLAVLAIAAMGAFGPTTALAECKKESECEWPKEEEVNPTEGEWPEEKGSPEEEEAAGRDPILFVHGYWGGVGTFKEMKKRFEADGWPASRLHNWAYDWTKSNVTTAEKISELVDKLRKITGANQVDIITHSMGGLSSRYYVKFLFGTEKVDDWISLGGPNHGTTAANFCGHTSCVEMRPNSTFLNALNEADETPGEEVSYITWRTVEKCDPVIDPAESVELVGAVNIIIEGCVSHTNLHQNEKIYKEVREWVIF